MSHSQLTCEAARERLSARLDGEPAHEEDALSAHLARCAACRDHELGLQVLTRGFSALREERKPLADLWPRIERRARARRSGPILVRIAAGLVGFMGVGTGALVVERSNAPGTPRHLLERLSPPGGPDTLFAALPEYRVLRALPTAEESR